MLTQEEDVEIHALRKQGWSISAMARHTGRDRKTVWASLTGDLAGVRVRAEEDPFDRIEPYVRQRLSDDRHMWATADGTPLVSEEALGGLMARVEETDGELLGTEGLLSQVTKAVLERALDEGLTGHLGYERGDLGGRGSGNSAISNPGSCLEVRNVSRGSASGSVLFMPGG